MKTYIAILRGINVSGQRKLPMADLKSMLEKMGCQNVSTYIQSGNVALQSPESAEKLAGSMEKMIKKKFGYDVPVIVRTGTELKSILKKNPFLKRKGVPTDKLHVTFLAEIPAKEALTKIKEYAYPPDEFVITGKEVYLLCPDSYGNTKLNNGFFESKLKVKATTRNWKTVGVLAEMADEMK